MTITPLGAAGSVGVVASAAPAAVDALAPAAPAAPAAPQAATGPVASPQASAPAAAVNAAVQAAAAQQGGLAGLLADLGAALQTPGLPSAVAAAATQVLALRLPADPAPSAADLRQALTQSGLLLEAQLATGAPPGLDLKAALLQLGQALRAAPDAAPPDHAAQAAPAPPYPGGPVRGQPPALPSLAAGADTGAVVQRLLRETGGALARQLLLQAASLPAAPRAGEAQSARWQFEAPLALPQGAAVAQFEIGRDGGPGGGGDDGEAGPVWRARFSLDAPPMGAVHASIALSGQRARVTLWAENTDTAERLRGAAAGLTQALVADDLAAQVAVYPGATPAPAPPAPGQFVDRDL